MKQIVIGDKFKNKCLLILTMVLLVLYAVNSHAATSMTIGGVASSITKSFSSLAKMITATSYIAGLGFAMSSILKFKQHKDNPTQIPVGTPIALLFIAAALLFLPSILGVAGETVFGSNAVSAGPGGTIYE